MAITYETLFSKALNCSPNESKPLEEYTKAELIQLIHTLKEGIDILAIPRKKPKSILQQDEKFSENEDFGLGVVASNQKDLQSFQEFSDKNFLPISKNNCHVSSICDQNMIDQYLTTGINYQRSEYAMFIVLENIEYSSLSSLTYPQEFSSNNKSYTYQLQVVVENSDESQEDFLRRIREKLLGDIFSIDRDDHESIPSLPAPKQPQFVSIKPYSQIACWPLPRRRDLNRFREDLGITHIVTLLNHKEIQNSHICHLVETHGMKSVHIPIDGADLSVFTSSQATLDVLTEQIPTIRHFLLNSTETTPVKMLIHCAAGLHRTGTITYLLLRLCQFSMDQALLIINRTRAITARQVGYKRINAVEQHLLAKIPQ